MPPCHIGLNQKSQKGKILEMPPLEVLKADCKRKLIVFAFFI